MVLLEGNLSASLSWLIPSVSIWCSSHTCIQNWLFFWSCALHSTLRKVFLQLWWQSLADPLHVYQEVVIKYALFFPLWTTIYLNMQGQKFDNDMEDTLATRMLRRRSSQRSRTSTCSYSTIQVPFVYIIIKHISISSSFNLPWEQYHWSETITGHTHKCTHLTYSLICLYETHKIFSQSMQSSQNKYKTVH